MLTQLKDSPSFGWTDRMHTNIVANILKETNISPTKLAIIKESVQKPDFDEVFLYGLNHFYYPNKKMKSYLDLTGKHNAKYVYNQHINNMQHEINNDKALDEAGRALHYLHDITQPNHIESGSILRKAIDKKMHSNFEQKAFAKQNEFFDNAEPHNFTSNSFDSLFDDTIKITQQIEYPSNKNKNNWHNIAQQGINVALGATKRFIELLDKKLLF